MTANHRPTWRDLAGAVLVGPALGAGAVALLGVAGVGVPWSIGVAAGLAVGLLAATVPHLAATDPPCRAPTPPSQGSSAAPLGDLNALQFALEEASRDPVRFEQRIRPRLTQLVADRLWQRHGLDLRTAEGWHAAGPLLGPHARALLAAPPGTLQLTPDTLGLWLAELETS